jgi:hypothetical protein
MSWNGSGTFNRLFSWVADKAAGLDISSSRMDADTNDIVSNGFGNCLTRDGQGQPTTNLPMATFRHQNVGNGVARNDYPALGQAQDGLLNWTIASGSADAITVTYTPALVTLNDGQLCWFRATSSNATTTPTFAPNSLTSHPITKVGGSAVAIGDIQANQEVILRYNFANTRWELVNPSLSSSIGSLPTTGALQPTLKTTPDVGWLLMDDGTFGSVSSGSSNSNSAANQALFTLIFNNISDTYAPILTSTGSATTRSAQGTASAAWAANCRMSLPKMLGRALAFASTGAGLTSRALGQIFGEENHTLSLSEIPTGIASSGSNSISVSAIGGGGTGVPTTTGPANVTNASVAGGSGAIVPSSTSGSWGGSNNFQGTNSISVVSNNTSGGSHNTMQPSVFVNVMVKQ